MQAALSPIAMMMNVAMASEIISPVRRRAGFSLGIEFSSLSVFVFLPIVMVPSCGPAIHPLGKPVAEFVFLGLAHVKAEFAAPPQHVIRRAGPFLLDQI